MFLYFANSKFVCYDDSMGYFNRDSNNRSGRDNRGGGRPTRNNGPREMFKTTCSNCGKDCEVPFRPTTGKPVYCSDCFEKMGGRSDKQSLPFQGRPDRSDFKQQSPRTDDNKAQFDSLNAKHESLMTKIDKIIELLTPAVKIPKVKKVTSKVK